MRQILSAAEGTAGLRCIDSTHVQCNVGAIDAAALGPFKKQAHHGHGRENEKSLLYFACGYSGWYNFGEIIKTVATKCHILKLKCTKFVSQTALGELTAPPCPIAGFKGPTFKEKGERKGRGRKVVRGEEGKGKWKGRGST